MYVEEMYMCYLLYMLRRISTIRPGYHVSQELQNQSFLSVQRPPHPLLHLSGFPHSRFPPNVLNTLIKLPPSVGLLSNFFSLAYRFS